LTLVAFGAIGGAIFVFQRNGKNRHQEQSKKFRLALVEALKATPSKDFDFNEFVSRKRIKWNIAVSVAEDVYAAA